MKSISYKVKCGIILALALASLLKFRQLRVTVKTAAAHQTVLVLRKCDRPTGQRRTVCQVQIVQQCQRMPLGKRRLNRAVRQPDSHGLPKRFQ